MVDTSKWPKHIVQLKLKDIDYFGIDYKENKLYWDGHPIAFTLNTTEKVWAIIVSTIVALGGLGSAAQGWAAYHDWACKNDWPKVTCPPKEATSPAPAAH